MADEKQFSVLRAGAGHGPTDRVQKSSPSSSGTASQTTGSASNANANPRSCVTCRRRKVKCDKKNPCSNCQKARIECVFPSPARVPRKPRRAADGELLERLRRLEGALQSLGAQVDEDQASRSPDANEEIREDDPKETFKQWRKVGTDRIESYDGGASVQPADGQMSPDTVTRFGRLVINQGKSRYINNSFWASLNSEVEDLKGMFDESSDDEEDYPSPDSSEQSTSHQGFIFSFSSTRVNMFKLHPPRESIPRIWSIFTQNVDPLVKVLHIPTVEPVILEAKDHLDNLPKGLEALMFSVYYAVVTSLLEEECFGEFGETQQVLLTRYRFAVEQALARAGFLDTHEVIVLQAAIIFLLVLRRNDDARIIWTLTGLIVRIAQNLGIHRDGSHFNVSPFEIEMRRRLWWQICLLDARASEDHGADPTILEAQFDTQMPLNVNDSDIHPGMTELPESRKGFTEMTFGLIRFEIANIFRRLLYVPPSPMKCNMHVASITIEQKEKWIGEFHKRIEETYLQDVDLSVPLYWVAATLSRLVLSKMWLVIYHPFQRLDGGTSLPQDTRDRLFVSSLESVEYSVLLDNDPRTRKWGWLFKTYVQWHSIAFLFSELCVRTKGPLVNRAWRALEGTVRTRFGNALTDPKRTILWRPLRKLIAKARDVRRRQIAADMEALGMSKGAMLMESYPAIDGLLSRASSQGDSGTKLSPKQRDTVLGGNTYWDSASGGRHNSESARSPSAMSPNPTSITKNPASMSPVQTNQFPTHPIAGSVPGFNRAAQDFNLIADAGIDWLVGDMIPGEQSTVPNIESPTQGTTNMLGNFGGVPTESGGAHSLGLTPEEMNWESWDDLVREVAIGGQSTNSGIGMTTWF